MAREEAGSGRDGRVALITGGTRGVGLAVARTLAAAGYHLVLNYAESDTDADLAVKELAESGVTVLARRGRAEVTGVLAGILDEIGTRFGRLDAFVHAAATWQPMAATAARLPDLHRD